MMNWIDINESLPPDNNNIGGKLYLVTVKCDSWKQPQTMIMDWECKIIRGNQVKRWLWRDRIKTDAWVVTHWMNLPEPYMETK